MTEHIRPEDLIGARPVITKPYEWKSVDPEFDAVVFHMAALCWPLGFDVSEEAPQTFDALCDLLDKGKRLTVWSGACDYTIFGSREANYAFRAWHDYHHWAGRHPFTLLGETATVEAQARQLFEIYGNHPKVKAWRAMLYADIIGQTLYYIVQGDYPSNQRLFDRRFLDVLTDTQANIPR